MASAEAAPGPWLGSLRPVGLILLLLLVVAPLVELYVIIQVAQVIGGWDERQAASSERSPMVMVTFNKWRMVIPSSSATCALPG